jgi:hypothetical protein
MASSSILTLVASGFGLAVGRHPRSSSSRNLPFEFKNGTNCTPISPARTMCKDSRLEYTDLVCDPHQDRRKLPLF